MYNISHWEIKFNHTLIETRVKEIINKTQRDSHNFVLETLFGYEGKLWKEFLCWWKNVFNLIHWSTKSIISNIFHWNWSFSSDCCLLHKWKITEGYQDVSVLDFSLRIYSKTDKRNWDKFLLDWSLDWFVKHKWLIREKKWFVRLYNALWVFILACNMT